MKHDILFFIVLSIVLISSLLIVGRYTVTSFFIQKEITAIIKLEPEYFQIKPGEEIISQITIYEDADFGRRDVKIVTYIDSEHDEIVYRSEQTLALQKKVSFISKVLLPSNSKSGTYYLRVEVFDLENNTLLSKTSQRFFVRSDLSLSPGEDNKFLRVIIATIFVLILTLFLVILIRYQKEK